MSRVASRRWKLAAGITATALLLSGCASASDSIPELADTQLSPVGDNGQWFHDEYVNGIGDSYSTDNSVCGVSNDVVIEYFAGDQSLPPQVRAWNLTAGDLLWELDDVSCTNDAVLDGAVAVASRETGDMEWSLVDLETGEVQRKLDLNRKNAYVRQIASTPDTLILSVDLGVLAGVSSDGVEWTWSARSSIDVTPLADGYLGIANGLAEWVVVLDGDTGEVVLPRTSLNPHELTWASDGYVLRINQRDPEYAFFDLTGNEIERTSGQSQFGFFPRPYSGVTFPLDDHLRAGTVVAVDAAGSPAILTQPSGHVMYTREARVEDSEFSFFSPSGLSRDGSLVMFSGDDEITITDLHGEPVLQHELQQSHRNVTVQDGYLVTTDHTSTTILLPASG